MAQCCSHSKQRCLPPGSAYQDPYQNCEDVLDDLPHSGIVRVYLGAIHCVKLPDVASLGLSQGYTILLICYNHDGICPSILGGMLYSILGGMLYAWRQLLPVCLIGRFAELCLCNSDATGLEDDGPAGEGSGSQSQQKLQNRPPGVAAQPCSSTAARHFNAAGSPNETSLNMQAVA